MQYLQGGGSAWWKEQSYVQEKQTPTTTRRVHSGHSGTVTLKQLTLSETFKRKEKLPQNSEKAKNITAKIAEFIVFLISKNNVKYFCYFFK